MPRKEMVGHGHWTMGLALAAAVLTAQTASAGISAEPFRTGLFGVGAGQAVRIGIVNTGDARSVIDPCFRIWSAAGMLLVETAVGPLAAGAGTFVDFTPPVGTPGLRLAHLRAEVELLPAVHPPDPVYPPHPIHGPKVVVTLEVFDLATRQTVYTMPFVKVGFNPQPEPPAPVRVPQ